jgi:RND family efflux transporter MFP subunit
MRTRIILSVVVIICFIMISACATKNGASDVSETGRPVVAVETVRVSTGELVETIDLVGTLEPKFSAEIKSQVTAVVAEVYVTEWVYVTKGTVLARLDSREAEADLEAIKAAVLQARVNESRSVREWERAQKLKEVGLMTEQGLADARTAKEAAEAATSAAGAQLNAAETRLSKSTIRAPMDGVVSFRGVSVGDRVENMGGDSSMFRIVDNRLLDLTVTVPATRIGAVQIGQPLTFTTDALPGQTFEGRVAFINPEADGASRAVKVVAEVPNKDGRLKAGYFVKGQIRTSIRSSVKKIPRSALLSWDMASNTADVFVLDGTVAHRKTIKTGVLAGDQVEVVEGLTAGEAVVTRGAFNLKEGDKVTVAVSKGP